MRKIKVVEWEVTEEGGKKAKEDIVKILKAFLGTIPPQNMPRGFDQFRIFNKLHKSFDKAKESKELILEDLEYLFIKSLVDKFIPSTWGGLEGRTVEIEKFMNLKPE